MTDHREVEAGRSWALESIVENYSKRMTYPEATNEEIRRYKAWSDVGYLLCSHQSTLVAVEL